MDSTTSYTPVTPERWAQALRSGDYVQTSGALRDNVGFCCLGVLCELAGADWVRVKDKYKNLTESLKFAGCSIRGTQLEYNSSTAPNQLLADTLGVSIVEASNIGEELIEINDNKRETFEQIAQRIETRNFTYFDDEDEKLEELDDNQ